MSAFWFIYLFAVRCWPCIVRHPCIDPPYSGSQDMLQSPWCCIRAAIEVILDGVAFLFLAPGSLYLLLRWPHPHTPEENKVLALHTTASGYHATPPPVNKRYALTWCVGDWHFNNRVLLSAFCIILMIPYKMSFKSAGLKCWSPIYYGGLMKIRL